MEFKFYFHFCFLHPSTPNSADSNFKVWNVANELFCIVQFNLVELFLFVITTLLKHNLSNKDIVNDSGSISKIHNASLKQHIFQE